MKILLMLPYNPSHNRDMPDLGLGYLGACLKKDGHDVQLFLRQRELPTASEFSDFISRERFDVVGMKIFSSSLISAGDTIKLIRGVRPETVILAGGFHVSSDPKNIFQILPGADYAFYGEAEIGLSRFMEALSTNSISDESLQGVPNLIWRRETETIINERETVDDLNTIPFPAWDLMEPASFPGISFNSYSRREPIAPLVLTRGCPNKCTYCQAGLMNGNVIRSRSVENVIEEIKLLTTRFGVREIQFYDSNCAHRKGPLRPLLKHIIDEKIDLSWNAPNGIRIDSIDDELIDLMKKSGCFQVNVGIESGSPRILKQIKKALSLNLVRKNVDLLRKGGIEVVGFFIIGFPGETAEEINQTISLAMELPLTGAAFFMFNPIPGTEIYKDVMGDKAMDLETLNSLDYGEFENNLSEVPYEELKKIRRNAYLRFHLRPRIIKYILKNLNTIEKIKFIAKRVFSY